MMLLRRFACSPRNGFFKRAISSTYPLNVKGLPIKMPSLSPTMVEGNIVKWLKTEGDQIQPGDILCDIQTDKAVVSLETEEEGILAKILIAEDSNEIQVGTPIALMVEEGEDWKAVEIPDDMESNISTDVEPSIEKSPISTSHTRTDHFGPSVRLLLEKYGLKWDQVPRNGPHDILIKGDVLNYVKEKNLQPIPIKTVAPPHPVTSPAGSPPAPPQKLPPPPKLIPGTEFDDVELTNMRRTIAKRLMQSKSTIAHTYCTLDCCIDDVLQFRKTMKKQGVQFSFNDMVIKAVASALSSCPDINCVWEKNQLVLKSEVDISVAVATDAGLITPIVRSADRLGLEEISRIVRDLATRAKQNALKLDEFQGGTFTISNLGMFGIKEFSAIINPPQCAILAVGGGRMELGMDGKPQTRLRCTLSYDQSAISDDSAAQFMQCLHDLLEDPRLILVSPSPAAIKVDHPLSALV